VRSTLQLVSFETAKLAKELGFNENCVFYYNTPKYQDIKKDNRNWLSQFKNMKGYEDTFYNINEFRAPTQSLLQKWLREEYKITISISDFLTYQDLVVWDYEISKVGTDIDTKGKYIPLISYSNSDLERDFKTYEEALEKGLQESLKIIKNGKEYKNKYELC